MKIDIFTHVLPPKYREALYKHSHKFMNERKVHEGRPGLIDQEVRFHVLEEFEDMVQVISATIPPLEEIVDPKEGSELARISNDEMAEMVARHPEKYIAAIANLPLNDVDVAMRETERAIKDLGFKGIQIYTSVLGKPLSSEEFMPLYEMMADYDLPIWIHPLRRPSVPDYPTEDGSRYRIFAIYGWPYETTVAMTRLVLSGVFEKFPNIKFITHHCGGMVPYFADRMLVFYESELDRQGIENFPGLTKHPIEYFKMFYNDTALYGNTSALMCGLEFSGEDRLLFASDMPYDMENGSIIIRRTIKGVEGMDVPESVKKKIYEGNARNLLKL